MISDVVLPNKRIIMRPILFSLYVTGIIIRNIPLPAACCKGLKEKLSASNLDISFSLE
jgi:hypothetical protein